MKGFLDLVKLLGQRSFPQKSVIFLGSTNGTPWFHGQLEHQNPQKESSMRPSMKSCQGHHASWCTIQLRHLAQRFDRRFFSNVKSPCWDICFQPFSCFSLPSIEASTSRKRVYTREPCGDTAMDFPIAERNVKKRCWFNLSIFQVSKIFVKQGVCFHVWFACYRYHVCFACLVFMFVFTKLSSENVERENPNTSGTKSPFPKRLLHLTQRPAMGCKNSGRRSKGSQNMVKCLKFHFGVSFFEYAKSIHPCMWRTESQTTGI